MERPRFTTGLTTLLAATLVVACSTQSTSPQGPSGPNGGGPVPYPAVSVDPAAAAQYGYAPIPDSRVSYQPDVVFIGGGASSIRWASDDGLMWGIDANAPGARNLHVGSVMFATGRAVGRVDALADEGESRVVVIEPVNLGDIVRNADLALDLTYDPTAVSYQLLPDMAADEAAAQAPDASTAPEASAAPSGSGDPTSVVLPPIRLVGTAISPAPSAPPPLKSCGEVAIGSWSVKPCLDPKSISLAIDWKGAPNLKFGGVISLLTSNVRFRSQTSVASGSESGSTKIEGIEGLRVQLFGGVSRGSSDNTKVKLEVPVDSYYPIPPSPATFGLPITEYVEFKVIVEMAFSGANSTLQADGTYNLGGTVGDGSPIAVRVVNSIINSLRGVTLGPSGLVIAGRFKFQAGLGTYGAVAGPYAFLTASMGLTKGSVLGGPLADCRGASLGLWTGVGIGAQVDLSKLGFKLSRDVSLLGLTIPAGTGIKFKAENETSVNVFSAKQVVPDVPVCNG